MAMKADRQIDATESRYFLNETAEKGVVVSVSTAGSGVAMDNTRSVVTVSANSSGAKPLGVLLTTFVNVDQTRTTINWHKDEAQLGDKASVATKGWVVTNKVIAATAGNRAVLTSSGYVTDKPAIGSWNEAAQPVVGRFRTNLDDAGYATLYVDL
jgi:hypothetical protein